MIMNSKSGFTMAEVLVTLLVIGIVAVLTIPILIAKADDRAAKVAYKKAMSISSQGIKMLIANENECYTDGGFTHNSDLADCMKKVINGNIQGADKDEILTPDGMVFKFVIANDDPSKFTIAEVCGKEFTDTEDGWKGAGNCGVIVDVDGLGRHTKAFDSDVINFTNGGFASESSVSDQFQFALSANGVRALYFGEDAVNKGYEIMYGKGSDNQIQNPVNNET